MTFKQKDGVEGDRINRISKHNVFLWEKSMKWLSLELVFEIRISEDFCNK